MADDRVSILAAQARLAQEVDREEAQARTRRRAVRDRRGSPEEPAEVKYARALPAGRRRPGLRFRWAGRWRFDAAWLFAAFLVILTLAAIGIAARRFLLERGGGTVECGLRRGPNGAWRLGVASYRPEELWWFGALGMPLRPDEVLPAAGPDRGVPPPADEAEAVSLGAGMDRGGMPGRRERGHDRLARWREARADRAPGRGWRRRRTRLSLAAGLAEPRRGSDFDAAIYVGVSRRRPASRARRRGPRWPGGPG